jgi:hypothetical protein
VDIRDGTGTHPFVDLLDDLLGDERDETLVHPRVRKGRGIRQLHHCISDPGRRRAEKIVDAEESHQGRWGRVERSTASVGDWTSLGTMHAGEAILWATHS